MLLCDPYLSNSVEASDGPDWARLFPPPVEPGAVKASLVVATHDHLDHADPDTLLPILSANPECLLVGPHSVTTLAEKWGVASARLRRLDRGERLAIGAFVLDAYHAEHTADSISLVVQVGNVSVAQTGDGMYAERLGDELAQARPHALITVINGKMGNMAAKDAACLAARVDAPVVVPCHYGMFARNTEDPEVFVVAMRALGLAERVRLPSVGEEIIFSACANSKPSISG